MSVQRTLEEIRHRLTRLHASASSKSVSEEVTEFERLLLDDAYPDDCLELIVEIIACPQLASIVGIESFVSSIFTDMPRVSSEQRSRLLEAIRSSLPLVTSNELAWSLCDLVARWFSKDDALQCFKDVAVVARAPAQEGVMLGLDIMMRHNKGDHDLTCRAAEICGLFPVGD